MSPDRSFVLEITELDRVFMMTHFPVEVIKEAYKEMKRQHTHRSFVFLLDKGIRASFIWSQTSQGILYWDEMCDKYG